MIGLARRWAESSWLDTSRIAASLGVFSGGEAEAEYCGDYSLFNVAAPRARTRRGWRAGRSPSGIPVLLSGWIDNFAELGVQLGLHDRSPEQIYGAAFEAWGDAAEARIVGVYASLMPLPDGRIRMARSPMGSFPLLYASDGTAAVVCSIPRPIFAAGWPLKIRENAVLRALSFQIEDQELGYFEEICRVPDGSISYLSPGGIEIERWYDVLSLPATRFRRDDDYVEAANNLLADAVRHALKSTIKPAISLSGGLDSSIVADEILRQMPEADRLTAFSYHPLDEWRGSVPAANFADERPHVMAFADMHPRLDLHLLENRHVAFDYKAEEMFLASGAAYPAMVLGAQDFGVSEAAAKIGCDCVISAVSGNMTYSNSAPWAAAEFFLTGRWKQLWHLASAQLGDQRSMPRRLAAMALMPLLPPAIRAAIRSLLNNTGHKLNIRNSLLKPQSFRDGSGSIASVPDSRSQKEWLANLLPAVGYGAEVAHGTEQVFGIRNRDASHYRPLMEFCLSIPTDQYVRDGETRFLARRMAKGRLPEAQRTERRYARLNVDWFPRHTSRLADMKRQLERLSDQPELAAAIDLDRARKILDNWPSQQPSEGDLELEMRFILPAVLYMSKYVDFMTGRNAGPSAFDDC